MNIFIYVNIIKVNKLVGISTKASVQNLKFEVVQSKVAPKILSNEVTFHQIFKEQVTANQNSFIHIQFEVSEFVKNLKHLYIFFIFAA